MLYIDSTAMVKVVVEEAESPSLRRVVADGGSLASSALLRTEVGRALRRADAAAADAVLRPVLTGVTLVSVSRQILDAAVRVGRPELRSLDAIHLATALSLEVDAFVA